jgi:2-iminobutanoate/2-iminopropanoate deaminase
MATTAISATALGPTVGPFSHAIRSNDLLFLSGQVGVLPNSKRLVAGGVEAQTGQALQNLQAVLGAAGKSFSDVLRVGVYLTSMEDFAAMNGIYATYFVEPYPARTTIAVAALPLGACVEIDMVVQ